MTILEVKEDKLMLTRNNDFITLGGKFPRLTKKAAKARLKEIKKLLLALSWSRFPHRLKMVRHSSYACGGCLPPTVT
jgi:hypothetical protein